MKVKEIGNLTSDPKYGEKGDVKFCNFNIAVNNPFNEEDTEFVKVSAFGKQAEACENFLQKGSQVCVEGRVKPNAYIDNQGVVQANLNINANEVIFLNRIKNREQQQTQNNDGKAKIDAALQNADHNSSQQPQNNGYEQAR